MDVEAFVTDEEKAYEAAHAEEAQAEAESSDNVVPLFKSEEDHDGEESSNPEM
jgi:hypothetical protein